MYNNVIKHFVPAHTREKLLVLGKDLRHAHASRNVTLDLREGLHQIQFVCGKVHVVGMYVDQD